jgi:putative SOS response-associated peptidase YedK
VTRKAFFREPSKTRRCLMPVSGYLEWQDTPGGKQPHCVTRATGSPVLTIAGLWDEWKNRTADVGGHNMFASARHRHWRCR